MKNNKLLINQLNNYLEIYPNMKYVLFDLFDTIITRTVHPEYVKRLSSKRICICTGITLSPDEVYQVRNKLERTLCEKNSNSGFDMEFNFEDFCIPFYYELQKVDSEHIGTLSVDDFANLCCDIEIETEISVQEVDLDCIRAINTLVSKNIPVGLASDFYLSKRLISKLLKYHNIDSLFNDLFISGDNLITKRSGRSYDHIIHSLRYSPKEILIIGDNEYSDSKIPHSMGMHSYWLDKRKQTEFYKKILREALNKEKTIQRLENTFFKTNKEECFKEISLTLWNFIQKLHARLIEKK